MQYRETALIKAAEGGHTSAVEALAAAGADVDASTRVSRHRVAVLKVKTYSVVVIINSVSAMSWRVVDVCSLMKPH